MTVAFSIGNHFNIIIFKLEHSLLKFYNWSFFFFTDTFLWYYVRYLHSPRAIFDTL